MAKFTQRSAARWHGQIKADDIPALKGAVERMTAPQLSFYANAFKAFAPEAHQVVLSEIERRCVLAYVEEGLGE